jgi:hypothetical protein
LVALEKAKGAEARKDQRFQMFFRIVEGGGQCQQIARHARIKGLCIAQCRLAISTPTSLRST